ncbi:MAG: mechanosensitive ion channel [Planctomycetes bacterium]|nr:mechanosensitive ion channel [Planctomycetota bacterium]
MIDWSTIGITAAVWFAATLLLTLIASTLQRRSHPLAASMRALRNLLLPLVALTIVIVALFDLPREGTAVKGMETVLWLVGILVALSAVKNTAFVRQDGGQYTTRLPKLLLDILRLILVLVGACFVIAGVWDKDLGSLLTAVGISSIVLGLALQNTLDNVMAGIAVLFERPFEVGDWIKVGNIIGVVMEMNWRSLRVRTRERDMVIVPNSVIGKETLINFSRPTRLHGESHVIGFSYDDPPNKVKRVLTQVALSTRGVLANPAPQVRTTNYAAYSIEYQVRFFIEDYERVREINDEFMTQVWYAAKRNGLAIPFPIQTSYEYHLEMPKAAPKGSGAAAALTNVPVFVPLGAEELAALARDAVQQDFGRGERVVRQGDPGDALYVILAGTAVVSITDEQGGEREVARLARGEFFGEMALLTGEKRSANVTAVEDLEVLVIYKEALSAMMARRPELAQEIAEIVEARRHGLRAVADLRAAPPEKKAEIRSGAGELVARIKRFLGF